MYVDVSMPVHEQKYFMFDTKLELPTAQSVIEVRAIAPKRLRVVHILYSSSKTGTCSFLEIKDKQKNQ